MTTPPPTIIRLFPPHTLPCSGINERTNTRCGKPATAAYAEKAEDGRWVVEPVCRECWARDRKEQ